MRILFSKLFNALILFLMTYLLAANPEKWIEAGIVVVWEPQVYIIWWIILWLINIIIKPILQILSIPLYFVFLWLVSFLINWIILWIFDNIIDDILKVSWMSYSIEGWVNFIIAVAIFTILNMVYSILFFKK